MRPPWGRLGARTATRGSGRRLFHWTPERLFFGGMGVMVLLLVFIGFAPSFYLRGSAMPWHPLGPISPLVIVYGILFSIWVTFYIVQAALISSRQHKLHRFFGYGSIAPAVAMVNSGLLVASNMAAAGRGPPGVHPMGWIWISLFDLILFTGLVYAGYRARKQPQVHKRLMLLATLLMLGAALGRIPLLPPTFLYGEGSTLIALALMLPLVIWDLKTRGLIMRITAIGIGAVLTAHVLQTLFWDTEIARSVAEGIVGLLT